MAKKGIDPNVLIPWIGIGLTAFSAIMTAVFRYLTISKQLDMQREFMRRVPPMSYYNLPQVPPAPPMPNIHVPPVGIPANPQA